MPELTIHRPFSAAMMNVLLDKVNSSKHLDYMAKSCNVSCLGHISLDFFDYGRIISLDFKKIGKPSLICEIFCIFAAK